MSTTMRATPRLTLTDDSLLPCEPRYDGCKQDFLFYSRLDYLSMYGSKKVKVECLELRLDKN